MVQDHADEFGFAHRFPLVVGKIKSFLSFSSHKISGKGHITSLCVAFAQPFFNFYLFNEKSLSSVIIDQKCR